LASTVGVAVVVVVGVAVVEVVTVLVGVVVRLDSPEDRVEPEEDDGDEACAEAVALPLAFSVGLAARSDPAGLSECDGAGVEIGVGAAFTVGTLGVYVKLPEAGATTLRLWAR